MGAMFSTPKTPMPQPLPESPIQAEARAVERERAANIAAAAAAAGGRGGNMYAGRELAMNRQMARARRRQAASAELAT